MLHLALLAITAPVALAKLPAGAIAVPLLRNAGLTAYLAEIAVGTPPQKVLVKVDSGSPTYSVENPNNTVCSQASQPCKPYGTFDNLTSTTCHYVSAQFDDALSDGGQGDLLNDTVSIGGVSTPRLMFGYLDTFAFSERAFAPSILGTTLNCAFGTSAQCIDAGPYLVPQLKNASTINGMYTSFYLGRDIPKTNAQLILGRAYDRAKIGSKPFTLEMVDPFNLELANGQTNSVNVSSLELVIGKNRTCETFGDKNVGQPVLLDTGTADWYLPNKIGFPILEAFGISQSAYQPANQAQTVDCKYRDPKNIQGHVVVTFGRSGKVEVPLHSLVTLFSDGTCGTFAAPRGRDQLSTFGDAFMRGVYTIFDLEHFRVTLANVNHTTTEDIVPIPAGGFPVTKPN